ncbi:GNAT family N-acetyltransferase [Georgenia thermotolerans]|uniref:GNAT family N-acetyltransferase n=1 Tax=Georgenia thermotolerans TaxID=527326 RepID=A0A7J5UP67_9MICO|nr:GNAT family N-acetyltransferase [Georgenia thermotolerans]KAE8764195.1 GNAT family N-acetyltransferase [Georgenia thermotolerans]
MPSDRPLAALAERLHVPAVAEVPAPHLGLRWRAVAEPDLDQARALIERCFEVDRPISRLCPAEITERLVGTAASAVESLGGFSHDGLLRAMATVYLPAADVDVLRAFLTATIDPRWRGQGIGRALLDWQDARARQLIAADGRDLPVRIGAYVDEHLTDRRKLYVAAGFSPKRVYEEMRRPVAARLPQAPLPAGLRLVDWTPAIDDAVRRASNEAFADHWGAEPMSPAAWAVARAEIEPAWSKVAVTADGEVAAFALTSRHEHAWPRLGASEGDTERLGVLPGYRGRGVAQALLVAVVRALAADGVETAALTVDTVDPTVRGFYEDLGYRREGARILYTIEI